MNIIQIALLIGLVLIAIDRGYAYFSLRGKAENERDENEFKKAKRAFIWSTVAAIIYACIKLA